MKRSTIVLLLLEKRKCRLTSLHLTGQFENRFHGLLPLFWREEV